MELAALLRPLALATGPLVATALALIVAALATIGSGDVDTSPLTIASSALLLVAMLAMTAAAVAVLAQARDAGRSVTAPALAAVGTALVAGGAWAALFVLPALAEHAPEVLENGLASVVVGYQVSYVLFGVGWVATAVGLLRSRAVPTWVGVLTAVGGVLSLVPAPEAARLLLIAIAVSLLATRFARPVEAPIAPAVATPVS